MRKKSSSICNSATHKITVGQIEVSDLIISIKPFIHNLLPLLSLTRTHNQHNIRFTEVHQLGLKLDSRSKLLLLVCVCVLVCVSMSVKKNAVTFLYPISG